MNTRWFHWWVRHHFQAVVINGQSGWDERVCECGMRWKEE